MLFIHCSSKIFAVCLAIDISRIYQYDSAPKDTLTCHIEANGATRRPALNVSVPTIAKLPIDSA